jgi:hypothetical protein
MKVRRPQASKGWQCRKYKEIDEKSLKILKKKNKLIKRDLDELQGR